MLAAVYDAVARSEPVGMRRSQQAARANIQEEIREARERESG